MVFDFLGTDIVIRDYQGNPLTLNTYSDAFGGFSLIDPETPDGTQPVGHTGYTLSFSDEFQDGELDTEKWLPNYPDTSFWNTTTPGGHLTNTDEPQGYDLSGITFDADGMVLTLREESTSVPELAYTSGMVCSYPSFNQTYGYFEARMKVANANDAWSAFWLHPQDMVWPPEIDWMENFSASSFNLSTEHTFHYPRPTPGGFSGTTETYPQDVGADWHTFGGLWESDRIQWYVDGSLVKDLAIDESYADGPMYLIANLAGIQNSTPAAPFSTKISYIRAWTL